MATPFRRRAALPGVIQPGDLADLRGRRITLFLNSVTVGGVEEHVLQLARAFLAAGAEVQLVCPEDPELDAYAGRVQASGVPVRRVTLSRHSGWFRSLRQFTGLIKFLRRSRTEILHIHLIGCDGGRQAMLAGWLARVPARVCTRHIAPEPSAKWQRLSGGRVFNLLLHRSIAVSQASGAAQVAGLRLPPGHLVVVPNGIRSDLLLAASSSAGGPEVRRLFGIPEGAPVMGCVARLSEQKGLAFLIEALPEILRVAPGSHLLLVGDGSLRPELEHLVEELGLTAAVHFAGRQEDVGAYLAAMDLFVLPSLFEGMPLSLLEAMAAGLPILATSVGGVPEVVVDGVTGLLVAPADPAALAKAAGQLLADPGLRQAMGAAAAERAPQFSEQAMVERIAGVYSGVLGRGRA